jgi:hypothetical protein
MPKPIIRNVFRPCDKTPLVFAFEIIQERSVGAFVWLFQLASALFSKLVRARRTDKTWLISQREMPPLVITTAEIHKPYIFCIQYFADCGSDIKERERERKKPCEQGKWQKNPFRRFDPESSDRGGQSNARARSFIYIFTIIYMCATYSSMSSVQRTLT